MSARVHDRRAARATAPTAAALRRRCRASFAASAAVSFAASAAVSPPASRIPMPSFSESRP